MHSQHFLAGTSECTITPPGGAPTLGTIQTSTGTNDDLFARMLVISDGNRAVAIGGLDLIGMDFTTADEIRDGIRKAAGIDVQLINCSHTHAAPFTIPWSVLGWHWMETVGKPWRDEMVRKVVAAATEAASHLVPVRLRAGRHRVQIGMNRRLPTPSGIVMKPNPDGQVVPWVDVLRVDTTEGKPLAVLFSHAAHPLIIHGSSRLVSADYVGAAVGEIRRQLGNGVLPVFVQACGGDINGHPLRGGIDAAMRAGVELGGAAVHAWEGTQEVPLAELQTRQLGLDLSFQDLPSAADCQAALDQAEARLAAVCDISRYSEQRLWEIQDAVDIGPSSTAGADDVQPMENTPWWLYDTVLCLRSLMQQVQSQDDHKLRFEIQGVRIGQAWSLVAMTHELFSEYQLWYDRNAPTDHKMVLAYTNACESYVPVDLAFAEGGYEAASFPLLAGASIRYRHRRSLRPGIEGQIKRALAAIWA